MLAAAKTPAITLRLTFALLLIGAASCSPVTKDDDGSHAASQEEDLWWSSASNDLSGSMSCGNSDESDDEDSASNETLSSMTYTSSSEESSPLVPIVLNSTALPLAESDHGPSSQSSSKEDGLASTTVSNVPEQGNATTTSSASTKNQMEEYIDKLVPKVADVVEQRLLLASALANAPHEGSHAFPCGQNLQLGPPVFRQPCYPSCGGQCPSMCTCPVCTMYAAGPFQTPVDFVRDRQTQALLQSLAFRKPKAAALVEGLASSQGLDDLQRALDGVSYHLQRSDPLLNLLVRCLRRKVSEHGDRSADDSGTKDSSRSSSENRSSQTTEE